MNGRSARAETVAVIIPCWNAAPWIAQTITSALDQDHPVQVMVVDDGSTDNSLDIVRAFGDRVQWLTGPNQGVSAARNRGIAQTSSEWIIFLDSDDLLAPGTVAARFEALKAQPADMMICDWREFEVDGEHPLRPVRSVNMAAFARDAELACVDDFWAPPVAVLYRRSIVESVGGFRPDLPVIQDARFLFDAVRAGARVMHTPHVGAGYRIQPASLSRRSPVRFYRDVLLNGEQVEALWTGEGSLTDGRRAVLAGIYNNVAEKMFAVGEPDFAKAVDHLRRLGLPTSRRTRAALLLHRLVGLAIGSHVVRVWTSFRQGRH